MPVSRSVSALSDLSDRSPTTTCYHVYYYHYHDYYYSNCYVAQFNCLDWLTFFSLQELIRRKHNLDSTPRPNLRKEILVSTWSYRDETRRDERLTYSLSTPRLRLCPRDCPSCFAAPYTSTLLPPTQELGHLSRAACTFLKRDLVCLHHIRRHELRCTAAHRHRHRHRRTVGRGAQAHQVEGWKGYRTGRGELSGRASSYQASTPRFLTTGLPTFFPPPSLAQPSQADEDRPSEPKESRTTSSRYQGPECFDRVQRVESPILSNPLFFIFYSTTCDRRTGWSFSSRAQLDWLW